MLFPLDIPPGLNSDDTTFAAKGRWADGKNVRFVGGKPQAIGGSAGVVSSLTGVPRGILLYNAGTSAGANVTKAAYGTDSKLYVANAGSASKTDITPASGWPSTTGHISLASFGTLLLGAPSGGTLFVYNGSGVATEVTQAPDAITRMIVVPQRQVLAFGCNEVVSGTFNTRCIRISNTEDYTDWTPASSNLSDEVILDDPGAIVGAEIVGQYVGVWTETSLYIGSFTGNPDQPWRFDKVDDGCGLIASGAVATLGGVAYWMGRDMRVFRWSPGGMPEAIPCPIYRDMRDNFDQTYRKYAFAGAVSQYREIWFYYPDMRDNVTPTYAQRYIAFNVDEGTWFRGTLQSVSAHTDIEGLYSTANGIVGGVLKGEAAGTTGNVAQHEKSYDGNIIQCVDWYIQSADQYFDNAQRRVMVRSIQPDFEEQRSNVSLTLWVRGNPRDDVIVKGPHTISTATAKKGIRASGRLISIKFSAAGAADNNGNGWRMGRPLFDIVTLGER